VLLQLRFEWDEKQQSLILGSFFWLFWVTQIPGGMLAQRYGTKLIFGLANCVPCVLSFLIPLCARLDYRALVFLRALQGCIAVSIVPQTAPFFQNIFHSLTQKNNTLQSETIMFYPTIFEMLVIRLINTTRWYSKMTHAIFSHFN
jgi:MFS family permease